MTGRERLSASVEARLLEAGRQAVADGRADNLSSWVNEALRRHAEHDLRIKALDEFIRGYEAEHGEITETEMRDATRRTRGRAVAVRAIRQDERGADSREHSAHRRQDGS